MLSVVRHLRRAALRGGDSSDGQLLESFLARRDEAAFEALLGRHGPMVWGVCRRVLRHEQDVEDAFQATFLVLARKAACVRPREAVGNWLYGVAYRAALKARDMNARRHTRERQAGRPQALQPAADAEREELLALLDAELSRLPDKYREPVVLCELEGRGRREVARQLGVPEGTLSSRLATARKLLAKRLARYGTALSVGALAGQAGAGVPRDLLGRTVRALSAGENSARVVTLTEGVVRAMLLSKLKVICVVALVLSAGAGVNLTYRPARAVAQEPARAPRDELSLLRLEIEALRKDLQATRERLNSLEAEVRGKGPKVGGESRPDKTDPLLGIDRPAVLNRYGDFWPQGPKRAPAPKGTDPLSEAQDALKKLKSEPNDKKALEALERAVQRLREQDRKERPDGPGK